GRQPSRRLGEGGSISCAWKYALSTPSQTLIQVRDRNGGDLAVVKRLKSKESYGDAADFDQEPPPPYQEQIHVPVYHPTPSQARLATQLTEEEQVRIAQRIGLIQHLPKGVYDPGRDGSEKKIRECVICMMDFVYGDPIRFLPCMHTYHMDCIDDWLMRSFTCPSCMEPVDAALLSSYETN
uniref:RING finger protein 11 n=2 Tax=Oryzias latipes TaxID=8090 RepID=A0A3P9KXL0_ORYLA